MIDSLLYVNMHYIHTELHAYSYMYYVCTYCAQHLYMYILCTLEANIRNLSKVSLKKFKDWKVVHVLHFQVSRFSNRFDLPRNVFNETLIVVLSNGRL